MTENIAVKPLKKRPANKLQRRKAVTMYLFLLPSIIGFLWFTVYPVGRSLYMSLFNWNIQGPQEYVGLANYKHIFTTDKVFPLVVIATVKFAVYSIVSGLFLSFVMALLLNSKRRSVGFFRTMFYLPCMIAGGAPTIVMWAYIFAPDGLVNTFLKNFGITGPNWLTSVQFALPAIVIMSLWGAGGAMIIFIAGLRSVPVEYYESADIDGASYFRKLFKITLPVMSPVILYNLLMGVIGALQVFGQSYLLTDGGPMNTTRFWVLYIFGSAFNAFRFGYASALAWVLFAIILVLSVLIFNTGARWVFYGDNQKGN
ncbi:MAG: sugar ABC transporter permease [Oscillospiraceae bacterium]|jgi:multiple sugar transport system permease protein|nr:sugar ABC transporter permease [Oscillospiraceae bacterium]